MPSTACGQVKRPRSSPLGIKRKAKANVPKRLEQRSAATPEDEDVTRKWIPAEPLLHEQRETRHASAHVRVPPSPTGSARYRRQGSLAQGRQHAAQCGQVHVTAHTDRRTCRPLPNSISIRPGLPTATPVSS